MNRSELIERARDKFQLFEGDTHEGTFKGADPLWQAALDIMSASAAPSTLEQKLAEDKFFAQLAEALGEGEA